MNTRLPLSSEDLKPHLLISNTPLREKILVNRGWVSWGVKSPLDRPEGQTEGKVHLMGIIRKGESVCGLCAAWGWN